MQVEVRPDGTFDASVEVTSSSFEEPLPIGRQMVEVAGVDENGDSVVTEMAITVGQGPPAPERNRVANQLPQLQPGQSLATSGGVPEVVSIQLKSGVGEMVISSDDWAFTVGLSELVGSMDSTDEGATVVFQQGGSVRVSGEGFQSGTRMDVWLFSEPTLLGSVTVSHQGGVDTNVWIDPQFIEPGQHTLQIQAVGGDGFIKAVNLGVVVTPPTTSDQPGGGLLWWAIALGLLAVLAVLLAGRLMRRSELSE
jgi:hypothetical protein